MIFSQGHRNNWCTPKDLFKMLTGDRIEGKFFFKQGMRNQLISEDWRFLYVFLSSFFFMDSVITQITVDCFMPFGNYFLTYATQEFNHCFSNGMKQRFTVVIGWVLLYLFLSHNVNFVDCFWQDKLYANMRIRFNLKDRKY